MPSLMFRPGALILYCHIFQVGCGLGIDFDLGPMPSGIGRTQVGIEDQAQAGWAEGGAGDLASSRVDDFLAPPPAFGF
jgi:hypothetical protein